MAVFQILRSLAGRVVLALFTMLLATTPAKASETLTIGGSGAGLATMRLLSIEFAKLAPATSVVVLPDLGTGGALKALRAGAIDIAIASRELKADEAAHDMVVMPYGKTPFVFVTSKAGMPGIKSPTELAEAIAGRRAWPDGSPIRIVMQHSKDGDTLLLESLSPEMKQAVRELYTRPGIIVMASSELAADAVERTPGSLGTSTMALVLASKRKLYILPYKGVAPSPRTMANGSYPFSRTMYLVHKIGHKASSQRFLDFVASPAGQKILVSMGHSLPEPVAAR